MHVGNMDIKDNSGEVLEVRNIILENGGKVPGGFMGAG